MMQRTLVCATLCATALAFAGDAVPDANPAAEGILPLSLKRAVEIALAPAGSLRIALAEGIH